MDPQFVELTKPERSRTYIFPGDQRIKFENVVRIAAPPGRSHRLETGDGKKFIVPIGWLAVEVDADEWSF